MDTFKALLVVYRDSNNFLLESVKSVKKIDIIIVIIIIINLL